jgi:hypothetical protein
MPAGNARWMAKDLALGDAGTWATGSYWGGRVLQTDGQFPSIGSQKKDIVINPDTSVDVYFGPTAPAGHEANWVQTVPGKGWNTLLRL